VSIEYSLRPCIEILICSVSSSSSITFAYMAKFHSSKYRSQAIMLSSSIFGAIGILLPVCGYFIINLDWSIYIPFLELLYKPWRLYVLYCALPSLISLICLIWLPESPKFIYNIVSYFFVIFIPLLEFKLVGR
jgi:VNT family MFS transporter (synaptic vesicle glycoprotein 2)